MSKDYGEPPTIGQLLNINAKQAKRIAELERFCKAMKDTYPEQFNMVKRALETIDEMKGKFNRYIK